MAVILLTSRHEKPIILDEREIGAIVEYDEYSIIYMKHADHEIVVAESSEEIAAKMVEMHRKNEDLVRKSFIKDRETGGSRIGMWPTKPGDLASTKIADGSISTHKFADPGTEYGEER